MSSSDRPPITTFSLTKEDTSRIEELRRLLGREGVLLNKSEVVRLGLLALEAESADTRSRLVSRLVRLRPGRKP